MPRFSFPLAAAILIGAPGFVPAFAQDKPVGLTLEQYQKAGRSMMSNRDADGDGRISEAEFAAGGPGAGRRADREASAATGDTAPAAPIGGGRGAMAFQRFDANHDGFLDHDEIDALLAARFRRLDANGDGILTAEERSAGRMARGPGMRQDQ